MDDEKEYNMTNKTLKIIRLSACLLTLLLVNLVSLFPSNACSCQGMGGYCSGYTGNNPWCCSGCGCC